MNEQRKPYITSILGIRVEAYGITDEQELLAYVQRGLKRHGNKLKGLVVTLAPSSEEVDIGYDIGYQPFQRIRRITGYLVGGLNRWNNAKRAEETDRVKHGEAGTEDVIADEQEEESGIHAGRRPCGNADRHNAD